MTEHSRWTPRSRRGSRLGVHGTLLLSAVSVGAAAAATVAFDLSPELRAVSGMTAAAQMPNSEYNASFTFVRVRFDVGMRGFGRGGFGEPPWAHDYPRAERNFARILDETTLIKPYLEGSNIYATDDPEIFRYPIAYFSEPGFWRPTEAEVVGFRNFLLKGGFAIFDDFRDRDFYQFAESLSRVLPDHELVEIDVEHPVFDSFFAIESLEFSLPTGGRGGRGRGGFGMYGEPRYFGVFEDNDPEGRLMLVANYNNDIGDYWEWSDAGFLPIDLSNEAYKLGVNYVVYAMTH